MAKVISEYTELLAEVAKLPKPAAGMVRVFRGQTVDYPKLDPSGLRRPPRAMSIWKSYAAHLYSGLMQELRRDISQVSIEDLQAYSLWFNALAQQYGPGSDFLDVTYSIDIALWFALNKSRMVKSTGAIGPDGPADPVRDHPTSADLIGYEPWNETGWIYVLDLPLWNGDGGDLAKAGQVVDLAKAPEIFASSPRMRAQSGCLIYCRNKDYTPFDVRKLLTNGTPLQVRRPMTGSTAPDLRVADIYPSPAQDKWFSRFLSVPMTYSAQPSPPVLQRSIPVMVYYDRDNQRYLDEVHFHDVAIQPVLVHRVVPELETSSAADGPAPTIILLETPMVFPYAPADSDQWHHGLLWTDVPDRCPAYEFGRDTPVGELSLANVFFEFNLLEEIGWERVIHNRTKMAFIRGVWLRRSGEKVEAAILHQETPGGGAVQQLGFLSLFYDPSRRRIMVSLPKGKEKAIPLDELGTFAKPVMVALMLLRYLSAMLKCAPIPMLTVDGKKFMLAVACDAARLYRVHPLPPNPDWFVLRDAGNPEEPFTHVTHKGGMLSVESSAPFRDFPLEDLRRALMR